MFRPDLTPAQHVARREALAQLGRGSDLGRGAKAIDDDIIQPVGKQFLTGHRLDGADFAKTVSRVREILGGYGPSILDESRRSPTRTRPKGDEHEFRSLSRAVGDRELGQHGYELVGIMMHLSRRRFSYSMEGTGIFLTRHLLERSIERDLASWTGRLAEVEDAVLDTLALSTVWRHAFETGVTDERRIALPFGDGLIYGILVPQAEPRANGSLSVSGSRTDYTNKDPNPLLAHPSISATSSTDIILRTAIDEDSMSLEQCDLRDSLARLGSDPAMSDITHGALWRKSVLAPARPFADLAPVLDGLSRRLVGLLAAPDARVGLNGRAPPGEIPGHRGMSGAGSG